MKINTDISAMTVASLATSVWLLHLAKYIQKG
jgi:hypothetical protein